MAELDERYREWIAAPCDATMNAMMSAARTQAYKQAANHHSIQDHTADDIAQDVCMTLLTKLDAFRPLDYYALTRYVAAITTRHRLKRAVEQQPEEWTEDTQAAIEDHHYFASLSELNPLAKTVATHILSGSTIKETAEAMGLSDMTLRKKLQRMRHVSSLPTDVLVEAH